jgi:hypothetical protein
VPVACVSHPQNALCPVSCQRAVSSLLEFNEAAFERAAQAAHRKLGPAAPGTLNQMLVEFGF